MIWYVSNAPAPCVVRRCLADADPNPVIVSVQFEAEDADWACPISKRPMIWPAAPQVGDVFFCKGARCRKALSFHPLVKDEDCYDRREEHRESIEGMWRVRRRRFMFGNISPSMDSDAGLIMLDVSYEGKTVIEIKEQKHDGR